MPVTATPRYFSQRISNAVAGPIRTSSRLEGCSHTVAEIMRRPAINSANRCG
jgi:hypothetical protein